MTGTTPISWRSVGGDREGHGRAETEMVAWEHAVGHALSALGDGQTPIVLTVGADTSTQASARLYTAIDEHGQVDHHGTKLIGEQMLQQLRDELEPRQLDD